METNTVWRQQIGTSIQAIATNPEGSLILVAVNNEVLVVDAETGKCIKSLKGHKETVNSISWGLNGIASGGNDNSVIVWDPVSLVPTAKFSHNDHVQIVAHNPVTGQLLSCAVSDFGIWSPEQKGVQKSKSHSRILCGAWSDDGMMFALGHYDGSVSIRNKQGEEIGRIMRGQSPVWCLAWSVKSSKPEDVRIAIADGNQSLAFYGIDGKLVGKERKLSADAFSLHYSTDGNYIAVADSNRTCHLWTNEGIKIFEFPSESTALKSCKFIKNETSFVVGLENGTLERRLLVSPPTFSTFNNKFASRSNMTDVVIQHFSTNQKARIKCRDFVVGLALYKNLLVVGLPSRAILYESSDVDDNDMRYKLKQKLTVQEFSLIQVAARGILLAHRDSLVLVGFDGVQEMHWSFNSDINTLKVTGGAAGNEGCLVGTKSGELFQVFLGNPFSIPLLHLKAPIVLLDCSLGKRFVSVIDDTKCLTVFDVFSKEILFQDNGVSRASWSLECEDLLSYSGNGVLTIKHASGDSQSNLINGDVVSFKGSTVFSFHETVASMNVTFSEIIRGLIDKKRLSSAYELVCIGGSDQEVHKLGLVAIEKGELDLSKQCFSRTKNLFYLDMIESFSKMQTNSFLIQAEIKALQGDFVGLSGNGHRALEMFSDLHMFEEAAKLSSELNISSYEIMKKQAIHLEDSKEYATAARLFFEVGETAKAIEIVGKQNIMHELRVLARRLPREDTRALKICLNYLHPSNDKELIKDIYTKLDDYKSLVNVYVSEQNWEAAFAITKNHPELSKDTYVPYARWLAINDRFEEAKDNFMKAGEKHEAMNVLRHLISNSKNEQRYNDTAYYYWIMASQYLEDVPEPGSALAEKQATADFWQSRSLGSFYLAYSSLFSYVHSPFTSTPLQSLVNMARHLVSLIMADSLPSDMSHAVIIYAALKLCVTFKLFKSTKGLLEMAKNVRFPEDWQNEVDDISLLGRGFDDYDAMDHLPVCFGCGTVNSWVCLGCSNCKEPFVVSPISFSVLPVVSFEVREGQVEKDNPFDRSTFISENYEPIVLSPRHLAIFEDEVLAVEFPKMKPKYFRKVISDEGIVKCPNCQNLFLEDEWNYQALSCRTCIFCRATANVR